MRTPRDGCEPRDRTVPIDPTSADAMDGMSRPSCARSERWCARGDRIGRGSRVRLRPDPESRAASGGMQTAPPGRGTGGAVVVRGDPGGSVVWLSTGPRRPARTVRDCRMPVRWG